MEEWGSTYLWGKCKQTKVVVRMNKIKPKSMKKTKRKFRDYKKQRTAADLGSKSLQCDLVLGF